MTVREKVEICLAPFLTPFRGTEARILFVEARSKQRSVVSAPAMAEMGGGVAVMDSHPRGESLEVSPLAHLNPRQTFVQP